MGYGGMRSKRGMKLIWTEGGKLEDGTKVLTAELYVKWYELYLVTRYAVTPIDFSTLEKYVTSHQSAYNDHVPNPVVVERFAEMSGYTLDPVFFEVCTGRWELEVLRS